MIKFHQDVWDKIRPSVVNLFKHAILFCFNISVLWVMIQLTDLLFPNIPLAVKIIAYTSETAMIFHFAKETFGFHFRDFISAIIYFIIFHLYIL